jgi:16S rRNA (guanine527-N7)-methyltransferase
MDRIKKYFPEITGQQEKQFAGLYGLYTDWNSKINVISRKDIENLYERHVLHSLGIARMIGFKPGSSVLDVGTGGGFPGIPLAILFPEAKFRLIDGVGKKIKVGMAVADAIGLKNISFEQKRLEAERGAFDFAVSRAVMPLEDFVNAVKKNIAKKQKNALPNGVICLKGGELGREILPFKNVAVTYELKDYFSEDYFSTKKMVYVPLA